MPMTHNGLGTMYYGKRRIHRIKSTCPHCNATAELESYDTTLFAVVMFLPVVPLGKKRILEDCPQCRRHRVTPLKNWESAKVSAFNDVLEKLQANPDDKEPIQHALGLAAEYQDEVGFDKLADVLGGRGAKDSDIQAQLGQVYEYFSRWPEAEAAYARAMAIEPTDYLRERIAVCMLKQGRPEDAAAYVAHVFEQKDANKAWLTFWLIEGFMAKGMHEQALDLMDIRDATFPELIAIKAHVKEYRNQRRAAEKNKSSGRPVAPVYVKESSKTGFRQGSALGFLWPLLIAASLVLGLFVLYLGIAAYPGQHRYVYLV